MLCCQPEFNPDYGYSCFVLIEHPIAFVWSGSGICPLILHQSHSQGIFRYLLRIFVMLSIARYTEPYHSSGQQVSKELKSVTESGCRVLIKKRNRVSKKELSYISIFISFISSIGLHQWFERRNYSLLMNGRKFVLIWMPNLMRMNHVDLLG